MALQSLAETLFPLADASATQPRGKLHSPFSPLVGWLATLWGSEDRERAKMERVLVHDPDLFLSPGSSSDTLPSVHPTETAGMTLCDDGNDGDNDYDYDYDCDCDYDDGAPEMRISPIQPRKHGLTKEEFDYVVNSLLEYLEEAELSSPESGCEEYEYYAPGDTGCRPHHAPWYAPFLWLFYLVFTHAPPRPP